ncbi:lipase [Betaproteobacteria bacterium]|nr:lipase [Betaproteobacteria bacterium]
MCPKNLLAVFLLTLYQALAGAQSTCELQTRQAALPHGNVVYSQTQAATFDAVPIVLLHGLFASKEQWHGLMCELSNRGFLLIAPDLPGYGKSKGFPDADYRLAEQVLRLREFLQALPETANRSVALAGNSMGGTIASRYARRYPAEVASLALFAPMGITGANDWSDEFKALLRAEKNPMIPLTVADFEHELALLLAHPPVLPLTDKALAVAQYQTALPHYRKVWNIVTHGDPQTCQRPNLPSHLPTRMPTLVLWGEQERLLTVSTPERAAACLPGSRYQRLPESGHLPQLDNPVGLAEAYRAFLEQPK